MKNSRRTEGKQGNQRTAVPLLPLLPLRETKSVVGLTRAPGKPSLPLPFHLEQSSDGRTPRRIPHLPGAHERAHPRSRQPGDQALLRARQPLLRGRRARRAHQGAARPGRVDGAALRRLHHLPPRALQGGGRHRRPAARGLQRRPDRRRLHRDPAPAARRRHAGRAQPRVRRMSGIPHPELEALRSEFPILQTRTYLNSCSLGALSNRSMGYLGEYQALWNTLGASAWYELWMGRIGDLLDRLAWFWNARRSEVALAPSVSGALASVASAVDYSKRNRVVVAELDFPTLVYQWLARHDVEVVRVPREGGIGVDPPRRGRFGD